MKDKGLKIRA